MGNEWIAYCGVNCSVCVDFLGKTCPGCRQTVWKEGDLCHPVECCRNREISVCGECDDFPCRMMQEFYEESESHRQAYLRMLEIGRQGALKTAE